MFQKFLNRNDGVVAVEYALIIPFLSLILVGIVDFGSYMHYSMLLQDLSRAASQYVVQGGAPADIQANVISGSAASTAATANGTTITYTGAKVCECANGISVTCSGSCASGDYVRTFYSVTLQSTYRTIFPYPGIPSTLSLTGFSKLQYNG